MSKKSFTKRSQCFSSECRLLTPAQYRDIFNTAERISGRELVLFFKRNSLTRGRLGLAVPKKRIKLAVKRNEVKRIIREGFRVRKDLLSGLDIVVLVTGSLSKANKAELKKRLDKQWLKLFECLKAGL